MQSSYKFCHTSLNHDCLNEIKRSLNDDKGSFYMMILAYDLVERPVAHMWSDELARGRGVFVDDMRPLKDELVAVLVQSKVAHAQIISIDFSEALKVPGKSKTISLLW